MNILEEMVEVFEGIFKQFMEFNLSKVFNIAEALTFSIGIYQLLHSPHFSLHLSAHTFRNLSKDLEKSS